MRTELILLEEITGNPWQTRAGLDPIHIQGLAEDIKKNGLLQPPVGRRMDDAGKAKPWGDQLFMGTKVQLAFGHNRLAAYRYLSEQEPNNGEWKFMLLLIQDLQDEQMAMMAWSENAARKDLTSIEEATAIQRDIESFGWTQEQAAEKLGLARATVANKLRLLKLPAEVQKAVEEGKISERQASALLPMFDLPEEAVKQAEKKEYNWSKPSIVLKEALKGEQSSDQIREKVSHAIREATIDLANCQFLTHTWGSSQVQSPSCANCTWRMKNKDEDRCRRPDCYKIKQQMWAEIKAKEAIEKSGLQLMPAGADYNEYDNFYGMIGDEKQLSEALFAQGCENLRIAPGYGYHPAEITEYSMVCLHGKDKKCTCRAKLMREIRKNDPAKAKEKENEKLTQGVKDLVQAFLGNELLAGNVHAWRAYSIYSIYTAEDKQKIQEMSADALAMRLVHGLVEHWINYSNRLDPVGARADIEKELAKAGLKSPWTEIETPAQQAWIKYARISGWMEGLALKLPRIEAIHGNIDNLYELMGVDGQPEERKIAIVEAVAKLEKIAQWVPDLDEETFEPVPGLVTMAPQFGMFEANLALATDSAIRYALALIPEEQNKARVERMRSRLTKTLAEVFSEEEQNA
jgi:ParB family chromosome partitioning protein